MFANPLLLLSLRREVWPLSFWLSTGLCVLMTSDALDLRRLGDMKPWHFCLSLRIFTLGTQTPCSEKPKLYAEGHIYVLQFQYQLQLSSKLPLLLLMWISLLGCPNQLRFQKTLTSGSIWGYVRDSMEEVTNLRQPTEL